jgi:predicted nucleic acid-binding protein
VDAELTVLRELSSGAWHLADCDADNLERTTAVIEKYREQDIGLADASNVVLADQHRTTTILTLDRRHFEVLRPIGGGRFSILP